MPKPRKRADAGGGANKCPACGKVTSYWEDYFCPQCGAHNDALYRREHRNPRVAHSMSRIAIAREYDQVGKRFSE